ncbi:MAG TPA: hypothetical protein DHU96_06225 [Actinobacteria bacterium]|nr:hypothetical protein [Actinomycetota bacterium]
MAAGAGAGAAPGFAVALAAVAMLAGWRLLRGAAALAGRPDRGQRSTALPPCHPPGHIAGMDVIFITQKSPMTRR